MHGKSLLLVIGGIVTVVGLVIFNSSRLDKQRSGSPVLEAKPSSTLEPASSTFRSPLAVVSDEPLTEPQIVPISQSQADTEATEQDPVSMRLEELEARLRDAEARIATLELTIAGGNATIADEAFDEPEPDLVAAGFDPFVVDEIKTIRNDLQLQRLDLRDRATREGWINSDEFRESARALSAGNQLRESLGDTDYDRLLLAEGRNNRVRIDSVIENSAADGAGIVVGDIINRYADDRIFTFQDLRRATSAGEKDEPVTIQIVREDSLIDLVIPRGPLGVTISAVTEADIR